MTAADDVTQPVGVLVPTEPTKANHLRSLSQAQRIAAFGGFTFTPDPQPGNKEAIHINGNWVAQNIVAQNIPQLAGRRVSLHKKAMPRFLALMAAWEKAGLRDRIVTFNGGFAPRYKRGKSGPAVNLSNHAFGSAFDINAKWNGLGKVPAAIGAEGCTRELVAIAEQLGWCWGGWWNVQDGMHFELARID
jgi:hypothetical protein